MADKDDFSFDKEPTSTPPAAPAEQKTKPVPSRALWLGLLLVVLGGAAYFYSMEMMAPEEVPVPVGVTKQLITPPPAAAPIATSPSAAGSSDKQEPAAAGTAAQTSAPAGDAGATGATEQAPAVQEAPKLAEKGVLQEVPIEAPKLAAEAGATEAKTVAATALSRETAPAETQQPTKVVEGNAKAPAVAGQPVREGYTLLAGAYVSPVLLKSAISKVRSLGYQPRTLNDTKTVEMTRVRIGVYAPAEAKAQLAELKKIAPDAFILPEGEQVAVYAASHFDPTAHNAFAEKLRQAGVTFDEEKALRKLPMTELFFGEFSDRKAAEKAAVKGRKAGLDIIVFKRP